MSININSISEAHNAYVSGKLSVEEKAAIVKRWGERTAKKWDAEIVAAKDENKYEITDDGLADAKAKGASQFKEETGYNSSKGKMITRGVVDGAAAVGGALVGQAGTKILSGTVEKSIAKAAEKAGTKAAAQTLRQELGKNALKGVSNKTIESAAKDIGKKSAEQVGKELGGKTVQESTKAAASEASKEASKEATKKASGKGASFIVAAPIALAVGVKYKSDKPNEEGKNACQEMIETGMPEAQARLGEAQASMDEASANVADLTDEASKVNEDAAYEIENTKAEFDLYRESAEILKAKAQSGEKLTEGEKAFLKDATPVLEELGGTITDIKDENQENALNLHAEIEDYQDDYNQAAEDIAGVQAFTAEAAEVDEITKTMCNVEMYAQGLNAYSGGKAAVDAFRFASSGGWFTAWAYPFSVMGGTGAVISVLGAKEQYEWAGVADNAIGARKVTEDLGEATMASYGDQIEEYEGNVGLVEDLEIEVPDDLEVPEDGYNVPENNPQVSKAESPVLQQPEADDKKEEKDKKVNKKDEVK